MTRPRIKSCADHTHYLAGCPPCQRQARHEFNTRRLRTITGAPPAQVNPAGSRRRIQALIRIGWPKTELAQRLGKNIRALDYNIHTARFVQHRTANQIRDLYDELCMTPGPSTRAVRWAERRGWAPPLAWEYINIDDPDAEPDYGETTRRHGGPAATIHLDDVEDCITWGHHTLQQVADRLGVTPDAVYTACRRGGRTDLLERLKRAAA